MLSAPMIQQKQLKQLNQIKLARQTLPNAYKLAVFQSTAIE